MRSIHLLADTAGAEGCVEMYQERMEEVAVANWSCNNRLQFSQAPSGADRISGVGGRPPLHDWGFMS
ncbi:MAG: hypothetical protein JJE30_14525 [Desulfuromonadales bacterium]|nr:hypothetical protein [Desulfuromonadales bacterium]